MSRFGKNGKKYANAFQTDAKMYCSEKIFWG